MDVTSLAFAFAQIGATFNLAPFDVLLQPLIDETLAEHGQDHSRKGTRLIPRMLIWLVLVLTLRRDLNYDQALNWMMSGFRWLADCQRQSCPARAGQARQRQCHQFMPVSSWGWRCFECYGPSGWPLFDRFSYLQLS